MIKIGTTGHRDLKNYDRADLKKNIRSALKELKRGASRPVLLCSIASGADQLCAQIALELGYELVCPLPFAEYRNDFHGGDKKNYDILLKKASDSFIVSDGADRDGAYLAAGKYIVQNCGVLLAVWDGKPQQSICGTAAIVAYAKGLSKEIKIISGNQPKPAHRATQGKAGQ